ncbi:MAG: hypothetical protein AAF725_10910 [Acidobacteriota bacterium]
MAGALAGLAAGARVEWSADEEPAASRRLALPFSPRGESGPSVDLPACREPLDRQKLTSLEPAADLAGTLRCAGARPSLERFGGETVRKAGFWRPQAPRRPILLASPSGDPSLLAGLLRWSLERDAAWVLEPEKDAFASVAWWSRPTHLVATAEEIESLAGHFDRAARRRSRLQKVLTTDRPLPSEVAEALGGAERECLAVRP